MVTRVNYSVLGYIQTAQAGQLVLETSGGGYGTLYFGASGNSQDLSVDGSNNLVLTGMNLKVGASGTGVITAGNISDNGNRVITSVTHTAGSGISITSQTTTGPSAAATINNTGVLSVSGGNSISSSGGQNPGLDTVQDIRTSASPTFSGLTLSSLSAASGGATVYGTWVLASGATFQATYADLAERYTSDAQYEPGTVLVFGGDKELTISTVPEDNTVAGVVTTNPAYKMNVEIEGVDIALQGRVPCKVTGYITKGQMLTTSHIPGVATGSINPKIGTIIGKALENYHSTEVGVIEVAVGRF